MELPGHIPGQEPAFLGQSSGSRPTLRYARSSVFTNSESAGVAVGS